MQWNKVVEICLPWNLLVICWNFHFLPWRKQWFSGNISILESFCKRLCVFLKRSKQFQTRLKTRVIYFYMAFLDGTYNITDSLIFSKDSNFISSVSLYSVKYRNILDASEKSESLFFLFLLKHRRIISGCLQLVISTNFWSVLMYKYKPILTDY